jgi:hypothetical protein
MSGCQCGQAHGACATEYQYAVKIVCGEIKSAADSPVAGGQYWTSVNIHNPEKCKDAHYRVKLGLSRIAESPISQYFGPLTLGPDGMVEYGCAVFKWVASWMLSSTPPAFIEGYFVIESDVELDIVAVYTGSAGTSNTFHTERVPARCLPLCEDLVLPLHTGFADWRTSATKAPVVLIPTTGWGPPPLGSQWVSQFGPDTVVNTRRYELGFDLCSGFVNPSPPCVIQLQVNDSAKIYLNGTHVPPAVPLLGTPTPVTLPGPASYRAGPNLIEVEVTNTAGQTGFALTGILHVPRGKCPCAKLPIAGAAGAGHGQAAMTASAEQFLAGVKASRSNPAG